MTRILYLTPLAPLPTTDGGRQRTNLLYQALARVGQVSTVVINKTEHPISAQEREQLAQTYGLVDVLSYRKPGQRMPWCLAGRFRDQLIHLLGGWQVDYAPDPDLQSRVAGLLDDHDLVVSRYPWAAAVAGVMGGPLPVIIDVDDRESERVRSSMLGRPDYSSWPKLKRLWWGRRIAQLASAEKRLLGLSEHFWLTKRQDLEGIEGLEPWSLLPNIPFGTPDGPVSAPPRDDEPTLLFVGSLAFSPNLNGVQRFLDRSWPTIHQAWPRANFKIVGGSAPEAWRAVPGVELAGFVDSLDDAYEEAAFSVVPLWEGAGTKIKVLESLQRSRTVVASRYAMRGYEAHLHHDESVLVGDDDQAIAQACLQLLEDPVLAGRLSQNGATHVEQHYAQGPFDRYVHESIQQVLAKNPSTQ